jgi:hypothetical protein
MNHPIRLKTTAPPLLITLALLYFGILPNAQAVVPAPDGGYPGQNTAEGQGALLHLAGGTYNTALGWASLGLNVIGHFNTGVGAATLLNSTGDNNTATGAGALLSNTTGYENTANGTFALLNNTIGSGNTAVGHGVLQVNTDGSDNTAAGALALNRNSHGSQNTALGELALTGNTTGNANTAIGYSALAGDTSGSGNIALGSNAGNDVTTANNVICIGVVGNNVDNSCYIGHIFDSMVTASAVFVNSNGRLGTMTSSKRFKQDIKPMNNASEALYSLKPVSFHYKKEFDGAGTSQLGLVAEDVERVNPDLVVRDKDGKPYSVRYDQVNAMLLNEFLKEHSTVQELKTEIAVLTATVKEQAAQIQKVSAQLEASKPAPQVVNNP